jgi:uncharacterized protein
MTLALLCLASFAAGFIDSVVGGGGLVQVPAFFILYPTLPVPFVVGTNRTASMVGTSVAAWNYLRTVRVPWKPMLAAAAAAAVMAYLGALIQGYLPQNLLKMLIFVLIVLIGIYTFNNKTFGQDEHLRYTPETMPYYAALVGGIMGLYNGCIGPGTGSLLVFGFVSALGFSFLRASAMSKVVNATADVFSLIYFFTHGFIIFNIALPMMVCNVAGSLLGSRMAILRGNTFVRRVFIAVIVLVVLRFGWDLAKIFLG